MEAHFCPMCGVEHGGQVAEVTEEGDSDTARALDTVDRALDLVETMVEQEEETERLEVVADATVDVAEIEADATVDVIEALTEESPVSPEETPAEVEPEADEPAEDGADGAVEETEADADAEGAEGEGDGNDDDDHAGKGTPVGIPPQLDEEGQSKSTGPRKTSAFHKRRVKRRR